MRIVALDPDCIPFAAVVHFLLGLTAESFGHGALAEAGFNQQLTQSCHIAEALHPLAIYYAFRHRAEVLFGNLLRPGIIPFEEGLTDFRQKGRGRAVAIPIVRRIISHGRAARPERLLVQGQALAGNGTHHIGAERAIAHGQ